MPRQLTRLARTFAARAACLEADAFESAGATTGARALAVVVLYAEWEEFVRRLITESALWRPVTASGNRVVRCPGLRSAADLDVAVRSLFGRPPNRPFTPGWGRAHPATRIATGLGLANRSEIINALGSSSSPAETVRLTRNFVAHRNRSTYDQLAAEVQQPLAWANVPSWVASRQHGRSRFGSWVEALTDVSLAAVV